MIGFDYPESHGHVAIEDSPYAAALSQASTIVRVTAELANSPVTEEHVRQVVALLLKDAQERLIAELRRDLRV